MTLWNAYLEYKNGKYTLTFETNDYKKYKEVEKVAQKMVDKADKERDKERALKMSVLGHL